MSSVKPTVINIEHVTASEAAEDEAGASFGPGNNSLGVVATSYVKNPVSRSISNRSSQNPGSITLFIKANEGPPMYLLHV